MNTEDTKKKLDAARRDLAAAEAKVAERDRAERQLDDQSEAARANVEQAERELKQAEQAELRHRLERAEQAEVETRESVVQALGVLGKLADEAHGAKADADLLRAQLGIPTGRDVLEAAILAALVESGLVDARALGIQCRSGRCANSLPSGSGSGVNARPDSRRSAGSAVSATSATPSGSFARSRSSIAGSPTVSATSPSSGCRRA